MADLDLFRETKYDDLMAQMQATNPQFAVMGDYAESGKKVKLTKPILDEFLKDSEYDGIVLARVDVAQVKQNWNLWIGGIDTKAELDVIKEYASIPSRDGLLTMLAGGMIQYVKDLAIGLNMYAEQLEK